MIILMTMRYKIKIYKDRGVVHYTWELTMHARKGGGGDIHQTLDGLLHTNWKLKNGWIKGIRNK